MQDRINPIMTNGRMKKIAKKGRQSEGNNNAIRKGKFTLLKMSLSDYTI